MTHLTTLDELKQHITLLASVDESDSPFISCYLNLEDGPDSWRETLNGRAHVLRRILKGDNLADLEYSLDKIEAWLATDLHPEAKGVAIFIRGIYGGAFMLPPCPTGLRSILRLTFITWWNSRITATAMSSCLPCRIGPAFWR